MKKSSLGRRSSTVIMSERVRSFGGDGKEPQRQKNVERESRFGSEKKSMLLKPGFTRRARSADRGSIDSVTAPPRSAVRSKSQVNLYRNPVTPKTPFPLHSNLPTGSATSSRSLSMDSDRRISSIGSSKKIPKDPRPIGEKSFQVAAEKKVLNFLRQYESVDMFVGNKMSIRPITQSIFVDVVDYLLKFTDDSTVITKSNYVDDLPLIMKKLCYPGKVSRSWLIIVNTQHTWPHVIALLVWLVDLVECMNGVDINEAMYPQSLQLNQSSDPEESTYDFKILKPYLQSCYTYFNTTFDAEALNEAFEKEGIAVIEELLKSKDCSPEAISNLEKECEELKNELNNPELRSEENNFQRLYDDVSSLKKDNAKNEEYILDVHNYIQYVENKIMCARDEIETMLKNIERNEQKKEKYKNLIKEQKITKEEKERIFAKRVSLERAIQFDEECYNEYDRIVCTEDIKIVGIREKLDRAMQEYNKELALNTSYEPSLKSAVVDNQVLKQGAEIERSMVDQLLKNIKSEYKQKLPDIESQVGNLKVMIQKDEENLLQKHKMKTKLTTQREKLESDIVLKKENLHIFEKELSTYLKKNEELTEHIGKLDLKLKQLPERKKVCAEVKEEFELAKRNALQFFSGLQDIYRERAAVIQSAVDSATDRLDIVMSEFSSGNEK